MNYPQTTGFAYTLASAYIDLAGRRYLGIQKISWSETMDGAEPVPGASNQYIAETEGIYKATCEFDILWSEYVAFIKGLGSGFMMKRFNIGTQLQDTGLGLSSLFVPNCRIIDAGGGLEAKAAVKTIKCSVLGVISLDGITAIDAGALAGIGNTIGGSAAVVAQVGGAIGFTL